MTDLDSHTDPNLPPEPPARDDAEAAGSSAVRLAMLVASVVLLGLWAGSSMLIIVFAIVIMIFLHELGHYVTARAAGMKCTEFFIGFGPRIWSFHRGETEYGIKAIPAGAYVKVIGMTQLEDVDPADEHRTYRVKPYWRRMSVAVAGSTMHFIVAFVCLLAFFIGYGEPSEEVWDVQEVVDLPDGQPGPAAAAGVLAGDVITTIDGAPVDHWDDLVAIVQAREAGDAVALEVVRDGQQLQLTAELATVEDRVVLGVVRGQPWQRVDPVSAVGRSASEFWEMSTLTVEAIVQVFSPSGLSNLAGMAVDTARSPAESPGVGSGEQASVEEYEGRVISLVGAARLGASLTDESFAGTLLFLTLINIFIGIFNLVPLLPLDGGHVAIATYEKGRELLSRSRERYYADVGKLIPLTYAVIFVLIGVGLIAFYLDIADPISL